MPARPPFARLLAVLLVGASVASGALAQPSDRYVTTPAELGIALRNAVPGDTVTMADGTWTSLIISIDRDGTEADSIRLRAETPGRVVLDGASQLRIGGDYVVVDGLRFQDGALSGGHVIQFRSTTGGEAHHSRLTNSAVIGYNPPSRQTEYKWVSLYGSHNRVDHSYFAGKTNAGATMVVWLDGDPALHRIDHNHFGRRPSLGQNGGETIRIGTSTTSMQDASVTVERNLFERCDGEIEIISNKSGRNTFRSNTFLQSKGTLTLRHGNGALVEGNFFFGNRQPDTGGIRVIGEDHVVVNNYLENLRGSGFRAAISLVNGVPDSPLNRYFQVKNAVVAFNTVIEAAHPFVIGAGADAERTLPPEDVTVANNVLTSFGNPVVREEDEPIGMVWAGNVAFGGSLGIDPVDGITLVDPDFEVAPDGLRRPAAGSPLLDAADAAFSSYTTLDMDGQSRPAALFDIGADERSDLPAERGPLRPGDPGLGPGWFADVTAEPPPTTTPGTSALLRAPFPNPTAGPITTPVVLDAPGRVSVRVYDVLGREVTTVLDRALPAGPTDAVWDASGAAPGLYVIVARSGGRLARRAVTVLHPGF